MLIQQFLLRISDPTFPHQLLVEQLPALAQQLGLPQPPLATMPEIPMYDDNNVSVAY